MKIIIINGPNLNLLGKREPDIYGSQEFTSFLDSLKSAFPNDTVDYFQSNIEGELVNKIQETGFSYDGIILNAAAYTHTSVAISDAIAAIETPVIEVHISNIYSREPYRHKSIISAHCTGMISGLGLEGYMLALSYFIHQGRDK
jgi:3-dehydroquinate dehydratase-2